MNTFLEARYQEAHRRYLNQCAYMQETNLAFAEKKGGAEALAGPDKARFEGIQGRLIDLVAFADAAKDYIESLQETIDDVMELRRQIAAELNHLKQLPETDRLKVRVSEEQKEEKRALRRQEVEGQYPYLFNSTAGQWDQWNHFASDPTILLGITEWL